MSPKAFDQVSFVRARKAQAAADLANGDITPILDDVSALQAQAAAAVLAIAALQQQLTVLSNAYTAHTHGYSDVDNTGAILNKTTTTV